MKRAAKKVPAVAYRSRIVRHGMVPATDLLFNEQNWRIHPEAQQLALQATLGTVGWVRPALVNLRTSTLWGAKRGAETLVDGHERARQAARQGGDEALVPVDFVDLTPQEEALVLATLDPIGAMAVPDEEKLGALVEDLPMPDALREVLPLAENLEVAFTAKANKNGKFKVVVECSTASEQSALVERLRGDGFTCRAGR